MSLRTKLLAVFAALAVVPLLALSVFDYLRSMDAVHRLIADQTAPIVDRAVRQIDERLSLMNGDLALLANNAETSRLYAALSAHDALAFAEARPRADVYLDAAWRVLGPAYAWISLRDSAGRELKRLGAGGGRLADQDLVASAPTGPVEILSIPVRADGRGRQVGTLAAGVRLDALAPRSTFETRFGRGGYTVLAGRISNTMYDPLSPTSPRGAVALTASPQRQTSAGGTAPLLRTVRFTERDTARVATVGAVPSAPFAVISSGAIDEYGRSFAQVRLTNLLLALALTVVLIVAFVIVTRRATRPLETLTAAAAEVGRGNFRPSLPPGGSDEVGRLSAAFAAMSGHIDRMMRELESSRQMVAVGSFARQIAHEIRNPLTSIKLNLQSLERDARDGLIASDRRRTVEICLEEIQRLDRVVRGVLRLGRAPSDGRRSISIGTVVERALAVMRPQLEQQRVAVTYEAPRDDMPVTADEEQLVGIFLNLFVNAAEAMPNGGSLNVAIDRLDNGVRVIVRDSGPGVAPDARARIFEPFFTTKREGSGLGLAIAMRDAERYRGRISVADSNAREAGATFIVELPLTPADNA